jgi:hypothetical protein
MIIPDSATYSRMADSDWEILRNKIGVLRITNLIRADNSIKDYGEVAYITKIQNINFAGGVLGKTLHYIHKPHVSCEWSINNDCEYFYESNSIALRVYSHSNPEWICIFLGNKKSLVDKIIESVYK